ncbi:uncharacterized protein V6R79_018699 [Siganus canaliculatus]
MDEMEIYANVERASDDAGGRISLGKYPDDIYENSHHSCTVQAAKPGPGHSGFNDRNKKSSCRGAAVALGLLCLVLLTGLIALVYLYTKESSDWEKEMLQLKTSYNSVTEENQQLQTSYSNISKDRDEWQKKFEAMTKERDDLQTKLQEWMCIRDSFYHVSSTAKTWQQSREECQRHGADLIVINSKEEQIFANRFKKQVWIGLTDSETEGTWKWVDGTALKTSYWGSNEPNGGKRENCGEIKTFDSENSWNDLNCSIPRSWICEKKVLP